MQVQDTVHNPVQEEEQQQEVTSGINSRVSRDVAGIEGEKVALAEWINPIVPGPHPGPVTEDTYGWNMIDKLRCTLCEFPTMQNIPRAYREVWAAAVAIVLRSIQLAEEGIELGLKWFLIIPKALVLVIRFGSDVSGIFPSPTKLALAVPVTTSFSETFVSSNSSTQTIFKCTLKFLPSLGTII